MKGPEKMTELKTFFEILKDWRGGEAILSHSSGQGKISVTAEGDLYILEQKIPMDKLTSKEWSLSYKRLYFTNDVIVALKQLDVDAVELCTEDWTVHHDSIAKSIIHAVARALNHKIVGLESI